MITWYDWEILPVILCIYNHDALLTIRSVNREARCLEREPERWWWWGGAGGGGYAGRPAAARASARSSPGRRHAVPLAEGSTHDVIARRGCGLVGAGRGLARARASPGRRPAVPQAEGSTNEPHTRRGGGRFGSERGRGGRGRAEPAAGAGPRAGTARPARHHPHPTAPHEAHCTSLWLL